MIARDESNSLTESKEEKQYLFIVRHGDRWDYQDPKWNSKNMSRIGDPPLSTLGHKQAREVGACLDSFLFNEGITTASQITWLSSPFLRCLQTSDDAIGAFAKIEDFEQIEILPEYSVFEWDGKGGMWHDNLPPLEERTHYFPRLNAQYKSLFVPDIPEPRSAFLSRCDRAVSELNQRFSFRPKTALIIVTHAAGCVGLSRAAANVSLQDITPAAPCGIFGLTRTSDDHTWTLEAHDAPNSWNGYTAHLKDMGTATLPWNHFADVKSNHSSYSGPPNSRFAPETLQE